MEFDTLAQSPRPQPTVKQPAGQRYFRVPFAAGEMGQRGFWFAHFDGPWIARQMEIHPNKVPVILVAGKLLDQLVAKLCYVHSYQPA